MEIAKIVIACICGSIFILVLDKSKEFGVYISLVIGIAVIYSILDKIKPIFDIAGRFSSIINIENTYIRILFQIVGIAFITEFGASLCKDAGQAAIASNIEIAGKVMIVVSALPLIIGIVNMIEGMM